MTSQDQSTSALFSQTTSALNSSPSSVQPQDGVSLIDSWISVLGDHPVVVDLKSLKDALQDSQPDGAKIASMLDGMGEKARMAGQSSDAPIPQDVQDSLKSLAEGLKSFSQQLQS